MARTNPPSPEVRRSIGKLNDLIDNINLSEHGATFDELEPALEYLEHIENPLDHRRPKNQIRDAIIAGKVKRLIDADIRPQAAYDSVAQTMGDDHDVNLDTGRIGQIYRHHKQIVESGKLGSNDLLLWFWHGILPLEN